MSYGFQLMCRNEKLFIWYVLKNMKISRKSSFFLNQKQWTIFLSNNDTKVMICLYNLGCHNFSSFPLCKCILIKIRWIRLFWISRYKDYLFSCKIFFCNYDPQPFLVTLVWEIEYFCKMIWMKVTVGLYLNRCQLKRPSQVW